MSDRVVKILAQLSGMGDGPVIEAALAAEYCRAIEDAAKLAETWGNAPPNPRGRRAALAAEIRALAPNQPSETEKRHG